MGYTPLPTLATGDIWTAANHNTYIRDNFAAGVPDLFTTKGDLAAASGANAAGRLAAGADGLHLVADSAQTLGLRWKSLVDGRRGGDTSDWSIAGSNSYTPTKVVVQTGAVQWTGAAIVASSVTVSGLTGFTNKPIVLATSQQPPATTWPVFVSVIVVDNTSFTIYWRFSSGSTLTTVDIYWIAFGI